MSEHSKAPRPETKEPLSPTKSDKSNDAFDDAVDINTESAAETKSVRSLTSRKSFAVPPRHSTENENSDAFPVEEKPELDAVADADKAESDVGSRLSQISILEGKETSKKVDAQSEEEVAPDKVGSPGIPKFSPKQDHRLSQASAASLDNVNLNDDGTAPTADSQQDVKSLEAGETAAKKISLSSITSVLPAMPWSPPASGSPQKHTITSTTTVDRENTASASAPPPPPVPSGRKLTSPFSWLTRSSTSKEAAMSPAPVISQRRDTVSSIGTFISNPEMMISTLEEDKERVHGKRSPNSLKDRFKLLRMRGEAGITLEEGRGVPVRTPGVGLGLVSPPTDGELESLALQSPPLPLPTSPSSDLAPGTASGVNMGPSAMEDFNVDWDLWQSVVYEGPAVVARTSPEELNRAIARGIPSAIRGVIWQVLAQSKNEELEVVYRELVARGTDRENKRQSNGTSTSQSSGSNLNIKEPVSSASSILSDQSTNGNANGPSSPTENYSEVMLKAATASAASAAERKRKEKEDREMLSRLEKVVRRDLGARTSYSKFAAAQGLQESLFGVCKAYSLFDEAVGYAQGMNFLIMPLLFNMPEDEAFCLLVRLMNQYRLRDLFIQDMPGLHMHLYQFERLLEDLEPALYCHLHRRGISPHLYATQWFLTLFSYRFPLQLVLRIYDLIFSEGLAAILKFGIVLMQKNAAALLAKSDMSDITSFLKDRLFDVYIDASPSTNSILENGFFGSSSSSMDKEVYRADQLVHDACEVKITPEMLSEYRIEWEEKTRVEKERESELEDLRTANAKYSVQVRRLEERIEAADREQAYLATEMVHTKVKNQELTDQNEGLRGQVTELRAVIEKQPAELELAWKLERDDLMKRNEKVHEENQRLEEELSELEEELVQTKMRYAELNSQHETLTRRWQDLKRQFD